MGALGGAVGLVAAPIVGAKQDGFVGLAGGVVSGLVGAVVLPVMGVGIGLAQAVRGFANTPRAIKQSARGMVWCKEERKWVDPAAPAGCMPEAEDCTLPDMDHLGTLACLRLVPLA
ncbi:hypothetical protein HYH03_011997 [Edaphochlamys debaryana]|uniref:Uncharacterized protein n=1 Tax=Edaphochlamys debaryana TaxID=47281 RepID=A0A835XWB2_9CHLO|nr:hypothetical protein HYH03_011997 [Edaphochlamys debaryana]|eukprot:KAG2489546.1 hypothetical protein HYH03_011997 [Edaphochlamys debaryana]